MRDTVHGEGVEPDFFFHDGGNCCIPAGFGKIPKRNARFRRAPYPDRLPELSVGKDDMTRTDAIARRGSNFTPASFSPNSTAGSPIRPKARIPSVAMRCAPIWWTNSPLHLRNSISRHD